MGQTNFYQTIRELRKNAGYTQADVSHRLNIQRQTYCNYENALRTPPLDIIVALAELYHVSVDYLVRGSDAAKSAPSSVPLTAAQKHLISEFFSLDADSQREVMDFIQFKKKYHG